MYNDKTEFCHVLSNGCELINGEIRGIEDTNVSIASTMITNDGIILISDSRSTKNNKIISDTYKKIVYLKHYNCGVVSTGLNEFGNKSFEEYINDELTKQLSIDSNKKIEDFILYFKDVVLQYIRPSGFNTEFRFAFYQQKSWGYSPIIVMLSYPQNSIEANVTYYTQPYILSSSGASWACTLFKNFKALNETSNNELKNLIIVNDIYFCTSSKSNRLHHGRAMCSPYILRV